MDKHSPSHDMTPDDYLKFESRSSIRHEYIDGQVYAMTGGTAAHNLLCRNLVAALHRHLDGSPCRVQFADIKVHVQSANCFYYPDVLVTCERFEPKAIITKEPVLIFEVSSPSTKLTDKREKLANYRKIRSLHEYAIVHQSKMLIELWRKNAEGKWIAHQLGGQDTISFQSIPMKPLEIMVQKIYDGLDLPMLVEEDEEEYEYDTTLN